MTREKTKQKLFTFETTTDAIAAEEFFYKNNYKGRIIPLPTSISASCGLAFIMPLSEFERFINSDISLPEYENLMDIVI
ncbi:MAG: DUF3343 domain-containing protein [Lachnospirales bacterium]